MKKSKKLKTINRNAYILFGIFIFLYLIQIILIIKYATIINLL